MPTYDYRCDTCGSQFELVQSFSDDALTRCPGKRKGGPVTEQCTSPGKGKVVKVFSKVGIAFKGDGFYKNDHGASAASKPTDSDSSTSGDSSSGDSSSSDSSSSSTSSDSKADTSSTSSSTSSSSTSSSSSSSSSSSPSKSSSD